MTSHDGLLKVTRSKTYNICILKHAKAGNDMLGIEGKIETPYESPLTFYNIKGRWSAYTRCPDKYFGVELVVHTEVSDTTYHYKIPRKRKSCLKSRDQSKAEHHMNVAYTILYLYL